VLLFNKIILKKLTLIKSKFSVSKLDYAIIVLIIFAILAIIPVIRMFSSSSSSMTVSVVLSEQPITTSAFSASPISGDHKVAVSVVKPIEKIVIVRKKDSLSGIFARLKLNPNDAKTILKQNNAKPLRNLRYGQKLTFRFINNKLSRITLPISITDTLVVNKNNNRFQSRINHIEPIERIHCAILTINRSIYASAKKANVSSVLIAKLIAAFKPKVNIVKVLRNGDQVALLYKDYYINGKRINKASELVAAEYAHGKEVVKIVKFTDKFGLSNFYTAEGRSLVSPFVRYPLSFKRVNSGFSSNRLNPVSRVYRKHTGVDFAARTGTPIRATSNGAVTFAGRNGGYGNCVIIKHNQFTTLYGHLLRFAAGVHVGSQVRQGQVIGYVGMTGMATGPHLHYEFRINNVPHDPLRVELPDGDMIAKNQRAQFFKQGKKLLAQLDSVMFASVERKNSLIRKASSNTPKKHYKV
jgi:murein DD-endopeptidase MepM/ murein hydrolase activator NlpD